MNTDKHTCVCATCGQGFTRKSSGVRHINNLHFGQAVIMKPYDYIIGRLSGRFSPGDPAIYRNNSKNLTNSTVHNYQFNSKNNDTTNFKVYADSSTYNSHFPNLTYTMGSQGGVLNPEPGTRPSTNQSNIASRFMEAHATETETRRA